jgi:hypothetical protein
LQQIQHEWKGVKWFIEGDIKSCFDHIDHDKLLAIIGRSIKDERFLKLLRDMLDAGYLEDWRYKPTLSGTPQGGVLSPLLANIFLNELDRFVEEELIPQYTKGTRRRVNPQYHRLACTIGTARRARDSAAIKAIRQHMQRLPSCDPQDPDFRRLRYVRYADDFLLGFAGPCQEAQEIKAKLAAFLSHLGLMLSEDKTVITHATTGRARFLGYNIGIGRRDSWQRHHRRSINGLPGFEVPPEVVHAWKTRCMRHNKTVHRSELLNYSDFEIVATYNREFQGLANYYVMAYDVSQKLNPVRWAYQQSLAKTLAAKHKTTIGHICRQYIRKASNRRRVLTVEVPRAGKPSLIASFGAKSVRYDPQATVEEPPLIPIPRNELTTRLLADTCELCGSHQDVQVHHIHKLSNLAKRYAGRPEPPLWVRVMSARRRKTLVVCAECHRKIHAGEYDGARLT